MSVQRYDLVGDGGQYDLELEPVADGGYVLWEDYVAAIVRVVSTNRESQ